MSELNKLIPEYLNSDQIEILNSLELSQKEELKALFPRKNNFLNLEIEINGKKNLQKGSYQSFSNYEILGYKVRVIGIESLPKQNEVKTVFSTPINNQVPQPVEKLVLSAIEDEDDKLIDLIEDLKETIDILDDKIEASEVKIDSIIKNTTKPEPITDKSPKPRAKRTTKKSK
jgi:hypothetical protein